MGKGSVLSASKSMRIPARLRAVGLAVAAAVFAAGTAQAGVIADYYFNGPISYKGGVLAVATGPAGATIIESTGLPAPLALVPNLNQAGSQVILSADLLPGSVVDNGFSTSASFMAPVGDTAALYLGNGSGGTASTPVLTGTLSNLEVSGIDGNNTGILSGYLHPNGGSAISYFSDPSDVIALDFNLSTNFSGSMYSSAFTGQINGQVESMPVVPLPGGLPLLLSGIGVLAILACRSSVVRMS
jgi:hypothetical protein